MNKKRAYPEVRGVHGPEVMQVQALVRLDLDHGRFVEVDEVVTLPAPSAMRLAEAGLVLLLDVTPIFEPVIVPVVVSDLVPAEETDL